MPDQPNVLDGARPVSGDVASGVTDSGNPVKVGGLVSNAVPNYTTGKRAPIFIAPTGAVEIAGQDAGLAQAESWSTVAAVSVHDDFTGRPLMVAESAWSGAGISLKRYAKVFKSRTTASITAASPATIWTPTSGKKPRVMKGQLSLSVAGQIILIGNATEILRSPDLAAGATWTFDLGELGILAVAANDLIKVDVSATGSVGGWIGGTEE